MYKYLLILVTVFLLIPSVNSTKVYSQQNSNVVWHAGFESGNLNEFNGVGEYFGKSNYHSYQITTQQAKTGNYSAALILDFPSNIGSVDEAPYLFLYDNDNIDFPKNGYYSAWFYIPSSTQVESWWNIMQWKKSSGGPYWHIDIGGDTIKLYSKKAQNAPIATYNQKFPRDTWVKLEAFYQQSLTKGRVTVWLNNQQIFDETQYPTVFEGDQPTNLGPITFFSVNNYTNSSNVQGGSATIYVDDIYLTTVPVDQALNNPTPTPTPTVTPTPTPTITPSPTVNQKYDLNEDGVVNLNDVIHLIKYLFTS